MEGQNVEGMSEKREASIGVQYLLAKMGKSEEYSQLDFDLNPPEALTPMSPATGRKTTDLSSQWSGEKQRGVLIGVGTTVEHNGSNPVDVNGNNGETRWQIEQKRLEMVDRTKAGELVDNQLFQGEPEPENALDRIRRATEGNAKNTGRKSLPTRDELDGPEGVRP
jgi:hypothetical protein